MVFWRSMQLAKLEKIHQELELINKMPIEVQLPASVEGIAKYNAIEKYLRKKIGEFTKNAD